MTRPPNQEIDATGRGETAMGDSLPASGSEEMHFPIAEERVVVDTVETETVAARISLRTRTEDVPVEQALRHERVDVERVPVGRIVSEAPQVRDEGGTTVIPVFEEVLVRRIHVIEEVRVTRREEVTQHSETVTLRRREVEVDRPDGPAPAAGRPPGDPA